MYSGMQFAIFSQFWHGKRASEKCICVACFVWFCLNHKLEHSTLSLCAAENESISSPYLWHDKWGTISVFHSMLITQLN